MVPPELEIGLQALFYLMTTVIHRLHETDPAWWRDTLNEIKAERNALGRGTTGMECAEKILSRAIQLVEHSLTS